MGKFLCLIHLYTTLQLLEEKEEEKQIEKSLKEGRLRRGGLVEEGNNFF